MSLDIEKAFDTIWVNSLLFKMIHLAFPISLIMFVHSYLLNRMFKVSINDKTSSVQGIVAGVPQGSILGPLLYTLGVYDIPKLSFTQLSMFADDTSIMSSSNYPTVAIARAQTHLNELYVYFTRWKIRVNPSKTTFVVFSRRRNISGTLSLAYGGRTIEESDEVKLLGLTLDRRLTYSPHVANVIRKAKSVSSMLHPLWKHSSGMNLRNRVAIFQVFIRPILTYAIQVWNVTSARNMRRVRVIQNKFLRSTMNLRPDRQTYRQVTNERLHELAGIEPFDDFVMRLTLGFYQRMLNHPNGIVQGLTYFDPATISPRHFFHLIRGSV